MNPPKHLSDWIKFESFLKDQEIILKKVIDSLEGNHARYEYQIVLNNFLQRYYLNFISIKNTWGNFLNNSKFKFPIYLLLRSLITDCIIMIYLIESLTFERVSENGFNVHEDDFIEQYVKSSNPFFIKIEREIENRIASQEITPDEGRELLSAEREKYPEQFEEGIKVKVKKLNGFGPGEMIKELNKKGRSDHTGIYEYYIYFSQFEHFTSKTEEFMVRDRNDEFEHLIRAVEFLLRGLHLNLLTMQLPKVFVDSVTALRANYIEKFWPPEAQQKEKEKE